MQAKIKKAIEIKQKQLTGLESKISDLQIYIDSGFVIKNESFVISVFAEKQESLEIKKRLENQIEVLRWCEKLTEKE